MRPPSGSILRSFSYERIPSLRDMSAPQPQASETTRHYLEVMADMVCVGKWSWIMLVVLCIVNIFTCSCTDGTQIWLYSILFGAVLWNKTMELRIAYKLDVAVFHKLRIDAINGMFHVALGIMELTDMLTDGQLPGQAIACDAEIQQQWAQSWDEARKDFGVPWAPFVIWTHLWGLILLVLVLCVIVNQGIIGWSRLESWNRNQYHDSVDSEQERNLILHDMARGASWAYMFFLEKAIKEKMKDRDDFTELVDAILVKDSELINTYPDRLQQIKFDADQEYGVGLNVIKGDANKFYKNQWKPLEIKATQEEYQRLLNWHQLTLNSHTSHTLTGAPFTDREKKRIQNRFPEMEADFQKRLQELQDDRNGRCEPNLIDGIVLKELERVRDEYIAAREPQLQSRRDEIIASRKRFLIRSLCEGSGMTRSMMVLVAMDELPNIEWNENASCFDELFGTYEFVTAENLKQWRNQSVTAGRQIGELRAWSYLRQTIWERLWCENLFQMELASSFFMLSFTSFEASGRLKTLLSIALSFIAALVKCYDLFNPNNSETRSSASGRMTGYFIGGFTCMVMLHTLCKIFGTFFCDSGIWNITTDCVEK